MDSSVKRSARAVYMEEQVLSQMSQKDGSQSAKKLNTRKKLKPKTLLNGVKNKVKPENDANAAKNVSNVPLKKNKKNKKKKSNETPHRIVVPQKRKIMLEKEGEEKGMPPKKKKRNNKKKKGNKTSESSKIVDAAAKEDSIAEDTKKSGSDEERIENGSAKCNNAEEVLANNQSTLVEEVKTPKKKKRNRKKKKGNKTSECSKMTDAATKENSTAEDTVENESDEEKLENGSAECTSAEEVQSNDHSTLEGIERLDQSLVEGTQEVSEAVAEVISTCNSQKVGQETFEWIIHPLTTEEFFKNHWEKEPVILKRGNPTYYKGIFSTADLDKILREQVVMYSKNLDITSYSDGKRETHNPVGRAYAPVVWDYYNNGCSVRMLNPQTFHEKVWKMLSNLQEYFLSFCGANVYLTPPDTQGFAPHWDDIEAFILQLEGKKRWRLYRPRSSEEELPRFSSPNLPSDEVREPFHDVVLEAGDLMYFPRGIIHQGNTVDQEHSLHITVSTYQKTSWADFLEKFLQQTLAVAVEEDVEFRKGLPFQYLSYMGVAHSDREMTERGVFIQKVKELMTKLMDYGTVDAAADQLGSNFIHDSLPPVLSPDEKECSIFGSGDAWSTKLKRVVDRVELEPDTQIRLIRKNCIRIVAEEEVVKVYHTLENSREYHAEDPQHVELSPEHAPAIETLLHTYPDYVSIEELPLETEEDKMTVAVGLWEKGIIMLSHPPPVL